jgi:hypothetical protein
LEQSLGWAHPETRKVVNDYHQTQEQGLDTFAQSSEQSCKGGPSVAEDNQLLLPF